MEEQDVVKIVEEMGKFMKQTNEMISYLKGRIDNYDIDISKIKKDIKQMKEPLIKLS